MSNDESGQVFLPIFKTAVWLITAFFIWHIYFGDSASKSPLIEIVPLSHQPELVQAFTFSDWEAQPLSVTGTVLFHGWQAAGRKGVGFDISFEYTAYAKNGAIADTGTVSWNSFNKGQKSQVKIWCGDTDNIERITITPVPVSR